MEDRFTRSHKPLRTPLGHTSSSETGHRARAPDNARAAAQEHDDGDEPAENPSGFSQPHFSPIQPDVPMSFSPSPTPEPHVIISGRSGRAIHLPSRYTDYLPTGGGLQHVPSPPPLSSHQPSPDPEPITDDPLPLIAHKTPCNDMGLFRVYPIDGNLYAAVDAPTLKATGLQRSQHANHIPQVPGPEITHENLYLGFSSPTAGLLMCWQYSGSFEKSGAELNRLWSFLTDPQFRPSPQSTFNHEREKRHLETYLCFQSNPFNADYGWKTSPVRILLPHERTSWRLGEHDPTIPALEVGGIYHRDIIEIIASTFQDLISLDFHMTPFEEYWQPDPDVEPIRVFGEAYTSPRSVYLYRSVHSLPREPGDELERVVVSIMLWSDATQLANFGDASLWPVYMFFGNQSKYTRAKPTAAACHHVAYIPMLPDDFQDKYSKAFDHRSSNDVYTHCKCELMQSIWRLLLNEEFVQAYHFGLIVECADKTVRRIFPQIYTYSADYPEKVLLACIRLLGQCLCPRCLAKKTDVSEMGTPADMETWRNMIRTHGQAHKNKISKARRFIFRDSATINGNRIKNLLAAESLVPTNAFSQCITDEEFNFFLTLVVDLLHKFEIGIWKAVFTHLMHILYAAGGTLVQQLNYRYRRVPTFGCGTIRQFHKNASAMKCLAARDFEDLLQCAMPVFEGLLPSQHNEILLDMLFDLTTWHAFAKLQLHTEQTLELFEAATTYLGCSIRKFEQMTCMYYYTTELPQEHAARGRRTAALSAKQGHAISSGISRPKEKKLNLSTYKFHALGDYVDTIRAFGTTDNYTTQMGELEHRRAKRHFPQSGKKKELMVKNIANQDAIERFIRKVESARRNLGLEAQPESQARRLRTSPLDHYSIAQTSHKIDFLTAWLGRRQNDPAFIDFLPRLKDHLLARARDLAYNGDEHGFSDSDRYCVNIKDDRLYHHTLLRVNYTTYDLRREQDTINPLTKSDIMVLSHEDEQTHPYWFVDRDMFMRMQGGGIGPKATWTWNDILLSDIGKPVDEEPEETSSEMDNEPEASGGGGEMEIEEADEVDWEDDLGGELAGDEEDNPDIWTLIMPEDKPENPDNESIDGDESDSDIDEADPDRIIPDDGEELDDYVYADEGYGAL
ncbi:hypothetical protein V8E55_005988 [Tylopilus felleus]